MVAPSELDFRLGIRWLPTLRVVRRLFCGTSFTFLMPIVEMGGATVLCVRVSASGRLRVCSDESQ